MTDHIKKMQEISAQIKEKQDELRELTQELEYCIYWIEGYHTEQKRWKKLKESLKIQI